MVKPILFNTEMVRAILDGRKTATRRVVKDYDKYERLLGIEFKFPMRVYKAFNSPCEPGDILYVRETWSQSKDGLFLYRAWPGEGQEPEKQDEAMRCLGLKWRPSIYMPREAARIWLRVTDVGVERLQEIDEDGAIAEGCSAGRFETTGGPWGVEDNPDEWTAREDFSHVWDSTVRNANRERYGWAANPWVWVIEFERCEKPEEA